MSLIACFLVLLVLISEAYGLYLQNRLQIPVRGYSAPLGFALILAVCQIFYYPVQICNASFSWIIAITSLVLAVGICLLVRSWKQVLAQVKQKRTLLVLLAVAVYAAVLYQLYVDLEYSDAPMYLNDIAQNINTDHLNLFNLYTGEIGEEWDALYLYQGYYHFCSYMVWLLNRIRPVETLKAVVWGMCLLYALMSTMLFSSILSALPSTGKVFRGIMAVFACFYLNFYYWRLIYGFYGNTWRSLWITFLMFSIWRWQKGEMGKNAPYLLMIVGFAGCACSSSYLFISFAVLSLLAAHLWIEKKQNVTGTMSEIVIPLVIYACVLLARRGRLGLVLAAVFAAYYILYFNGFLSRALNGLDRLLEKKPQRLFGIFVPAFIAVVSFVIIRRHPDFLYGYAYFFNNHQTYDMVKDYFFVYSTWYDNIVNVIRWAGVILIIRKAAKSEERYLKHTFIGMLLVFMNPLCTPAVAYFIASNVFYRAWEVLFNPFTELCCIVAVYEALRTRTLRGVLACGLIVPLAVTNVLSFQGDRESAYGLYYKEAQADYLKLQKMQPEALDAILYLEEQLAENPIEGRQTVVISQAEGTRVYLPQVIQLVTARDTYYPWTRVNEDLYQIARRHHSYDPPEDDIPYEETCSLMQEYNVDYVIDRYYENSEFDTALDGCSVILYQNAQFRVRQITSEAP